ncbi:hypothetical protein QBC43DRAFT_292461 [Cladorrhinum sp. PSN259]|nr:hypothetical protein QBC43DRAFT_292461 [Cladorrhinum sp. PSN259]
MEAPPPTLFQHVLRQKYGNQRVLKEILDYMFGPENYRVRIKNTRWILQLPQQLSEVSRTILPDPTESSTSHGRVLTRAAAKGELADIESRIRVHYKKVEEQ